ncbi:hypothetical protein FO519_001670 [Halicephalobus sp. NKZ332]|nr:hypothetical protein FO519_001670 [Halicephalobus sp. NKZ332]
MSPDEKLHPVIRESRLRQTDRSSVSGDSVNLLPETNFNLDSGENLSNAQSSCHGIHSVIFYGFIYCYAIAFGVLYLSSVQFTENNLVNITHLSFLAIGMPIGCQIAGFLFLRVQIMTSMVVSTLIAIVISMVFNNSGFFSNYCYFVLGTTFGVFERNVYLFINEKWPRSWRRRLSIAYIIFFLGLLSVTLAVQYDNFSNVRRVREVELSNEGYRPTKPSSAIGISDDQNLKTAENAEKRKLAELKKLDKEENVNCTNTTLPECSGVNPSFTTTLPTTSSTTEKSISVKSTYAPEFVDRGRNRISQNKDEVVDKVLEKSEPSVTPKIPVDRDTFNITFLNLGIFATLCVISLFTDLSPAKYIFEPNIMDSLIDGTSTKTVVVFSCLVSCLLEVLCFGYLPLIAALHIYQYPSYSFHTTTWTMIFGIPLMGRLMITMLTKKLSPQFIMWVTLFGAIICHAVLIMNPTSSNTLCTSAVIIVLIAMLPCELYGFQQEELSSSPFVISKRFSYASTVGRLIGPLMFSHLFRLNHTEDFLRFIQFGLICLGILFAVLHRATNLAIRQHRILTFTDAVSRGDVEAAKSSTSYGEKAKGAYSRLDEEDSDNCLLSDFSDVENW